MEAALKSTKRRPVAGGDHNEETLTFASVKELSARIARVDSSHHRFAHQDAEKPEDSTHQSNPGFNQIGQTSIKSAARAIAQCLLGHGHSSPRHIVQDGSCCYVARPACGCIAMPWPFFRLLALVSNNCGQHSAQEPLLIICWLATLDWEHIVAESSSNVFTGCLSKHVWALIHQMLRVQRVAKATIKWNAMQSSVIFNDSPTAQKPAWMEASMMSYPRRLLHSQAAHTRWIQTKWEKAKTWAVRRVAKATIKWSAIQSSVLASKIANIKQDAHLDDYQNRTRRWTLSFKTDWHPPKKKS